MTADKSNGYQAIAGEYILARNRSVGPAVVREWAKSLPLGAAILDVGCGFGVPISEVLIAAGFDVYGVDASEAMIAAFRERFPDSSTECSAVEDAELFGRKFDGVVAWGLLFLLPAERQRLVIAKISQALKPGGRFLFTAPKEACTWLDGMTGLPSLSLGFEAYREALAGQGLTLVGEERDTGENYYYFASKD